MQKFRSQPQFPWDHGPWHDHEREHALDAHAQPMRCALDTHAQPTPSAKKYHANAAAASEQALPPLPYFPESKYVITF